MHVSLLLLFSPLLVLAQIQLSGLTNTLPTEPTSSLQIDYTITSGDAKTAGIVIGNTYIPFTNPKVGGKVDLATVPSGKQNVRLVLSSPPLVRELGTVIVDSKIKDVRYGPKPEHQHTFREEQKMPLKIISLFFTITALLPWVILHTRWNQLSITYMQGGHMSAGCVGLIVAILTAYFIAWNFLSMILWLVAASWAAAVTLKPLLAKKLMIRLTEGKTA